MKNEKFVVKQEVLGIRIMSKKKMLDQLGIIEAICLDGECIWCTAGNYGILFRVNINTGKMDYISEISAEEFRKKRLYSDIQRYNEKLLLVPISANTITIYNIDSKTFDEIKLEEPKENFHLYKSDYKFSRCIIYGAFAYLFSITFPAIIRIDLTNYNVRYLDQWIGFFEGKVINKKHVYFRNIYNNNNKIYFASCCSNLVVEFNMKKETFSMYEVGKYDDCFSDIVFCEGKIYVSLLYKREILVLDAKSWEEIGRIKTDEKSTSISMENWNNKVFYFPVNLSQILVIENGSIVNRISLVTHVKKNIIYKVIKDKSNCYFIADKNDRIIKFSMENFIIEEIEICCDEKIMDILIREYSLENKVISDKTLYIKSWVNYIKRNSLYDKCMDHVECGKDIWIKIKEK